MKPDINAIASWKRRCRIRGYPFAVCFQDAMVPLLFGTACLSLFSLAHFSQATNTTPNRFLITSPKACFENVDCDATTSYCNDSCHCALRLGVNETCTSHDGECRDGLQCWTNQRSYESVCRRARPIGASCAHVQMSPCVDGAFCSKRTRTCRKLGGKKVGAYCNWRIGCRNDLGLYCNDDKNRCETLRKTGAKCELYDNTLCKGFCTDSLATSQYYMCFPAVGEGKRCLQDDQCHGNPLDKADISNSLVCNQNSNRAQFSGICIRHSRLLPHLGIACNPQRDACDSRKGLRCLWAKSRKAFVCQQRDDAANTAEKFCTPGSALSTCEDRMKPRECRRPGDLGEAPYGFFSCEDRLDRTPVKKGRLCYGVCEAGTSCLLIDSVLGWAYKGPPQPVRYCVRVARKGQACGNKFRSQCAVGLKCGPKKKCVKGVRNTPSAVTHVGLAVSCDKLPCSPGLVCERDQVPSHQSGRGSSWRDVRCKKPKKMVKAGQACYETRGFRPVSFFFSFPFLLFFKYSQSCTSILSM